MKKADFFQGGKYLKAADLPEAKTVTIEIVKRQTFGSNGDEETKPVAYFRRAKKALVLNGINWDSITDISGSDDSDDWPGTRIELYPSTTEMKGKTVPCIRIREPGGELPMTKPKPSAPKPQLSKEMDDEIPF